MLNILAAILANTDLLLNALGLGSALSSPTIIQEPPKGSAFREYLVSPCTKLASRGPMPMENSTTPMPFSFASRK